jgi:DNA-binding transcriptional LysR family regulator
MSAMHKAHLRSVDLNLLPVLDALLRHRNATRAGNEVGLTQPAMSRALGRLRHLLDDELLVRGPQGYALTPRAEGLRQPLAQVLGEVQGLLVEPLFEPTAEKRTVTIAMADTESTLLLPRLLARVSELASGLTIRAMPIGPAVRESVGSGEIDLVIALETTPLPPGTLSEPLAEDRLAVVRRSGHPTGNAAWTVDDYARFPSVAIALLGDGASDLDAQLARRGIQRRIAAVVPTFSAALAIVAGTDFVTTISRAFARRFADSLQLRVQEAPVQINSLNTVIVWSQLRQGDRLLEWLRGLMRDVAREN